MKSACIHCGVGLEEAWGFCPYCGHQDATHAACVSATREEGSAPFRGMIYGASIAMVLIAAGVGLCLSDTGMFVGFPLILVGMLIPLALYSLREQQGSCPHCGVRVLTGADHKPHACPHCGKPFAVDEHQAMHTV